MLQAAGDLFGNLWACIFIHKGRNLGSLRLAALDQFANGRIAPHQPALCGEVHFRIWRVIKAVCAQMQFWAQRLHRGLAQGGIRHSLACACVLRKSKSIQTASKFAFYRHFALIVHLGHEGLLLFQPPHQHAGTAVYKSLRERCVQRIRQTILYSTCSLPPMVFVLHPTVCGSNICPSADIGQTF